MVNRLPKYLNKMLRGIDVRAQPRTIAICCKERIGFPRLITDLFQKEPQRVLNIMLLLIKLLLSIQSYNLQHVEYNNNQNEFLKISCE